MREVRDVFELIQVIYDDEELMKDKEFAIIQEMLKDKNFSITGLKEHHSDLYAWVIKATKEFWNKRGVN